MGEVIDFASRAAKHRIGEHSADYSRLTPEQIAVDNPDLVALRENSRPRWPNGIDDLEF